MEKLFLVYVFVVLGSAIICGATTYTVGDTSGWDISTNLGTWVKDKVFNVGDILVFQYSSTHSVSEVTRESFDSCNTTNVLKAYSNGNTTLQLTKPGERYFVCGNKLHCLGGMNLKVKVEGNQTYAPVGSPQATPGSNDQSNNPSSKNNINPSTTSSAFRHNIIGGTSNNVVLYSLGLVVFMLWNMNII